MRRKTSIRRGTTGWSTVHLSHLWPSVFGVPFRWKTRHLDRWLQLSRLRAECEAVAAMHVFTLTKSPLSGKDLVATRSQLAKSS